MSIYDDAGVIQIPSAYKKSLSNGTLYSVVPSNGDGDFTFTRGSSATRVNKDGLIEEVSSHIARLDYPLIDGVVQDCPALLLEPQRTNEITYSNGFNDSSWDKTNVTVTANSAISPDGTNNAWLLQVTSDDDRHYLRVSGATTSTVSISIFAKKGTTDYAYFFCGGTVNIQAIFDLSDGSVTDSGAIGSGSSFTSASSISLGNGWYRLQISGTFSSPPANRIGILPYYQSTFDGNPATSWQGNGENIYVYGAMEEQASYATSYIPTSGSTVTRSADVCNGSGTSAEFNDSEGVLFAEIAKDTTSVDGGVAISDSSYTNRVLFYFDTTGNIRAYVYSSGEQASIVTSGLDYTNNNKLALKYSATSTKFFVNGFQIGSTDTSSTMPIGLSELAFDDGGGGSDFYGKTKQLMTFKTALTDSELETLTSWDSFNAMAKGQLYTIE